MGEYMNRNKEVLFQDVAGGVAAVKKGGYAFICESLYQEYEISKDCNLEQVGGLFKPVFTAIGIKKGRCLTEIKKKCKTSLGYSNSKEINQAIIKLLDDGELDELKDKWWPKKTSCKVNILSIRQLPP